MRITKQKCIYHNQIIEEEYEVRIQIKKGDIITFIVDVEDWCIINHRPKSEYDKRRFNKLSSKQHDEISELIEEMGIDE